MHFPTYLHLSVLVHCAIGYDMQRLSDNHCNCSVQIRAIPACLIFTSSSMVNWRWRRGDMHDKIRPLPSI